MSCNNCVFLCRIYSETSPLTTFNDLSRVDIQGLSSAVRLDTLNTMLSTMTAMLGTTKGNSRVELNVCVNPNRTRLDFGGHSLGPLQVLSPDRGTKTHSSIVGTSEDIRFVCPLQDREDRACRMLVPYS